jgi:hypothetical protein
VRHRLSRAGNRRMNHMMHAHRRGHPDPPRHSWPCLLLHDRFVILSGRAAVVGLCADGANTRSSADPCA